VTVDAPNFKPVGRLLNIVERETKTRGINYGEQPWMDEFSVVETEDTPASYNIQKASHSIRGFPRSIDFQKTKNEYILSFNNFDANHRFSSLVITFPSREEALRFGASHGGSTETFKTEMDVTLAKLLPKGKGRVKHVIEQILIKGGIKSLFAVPVRDRQGPQ